MVIKNFNTIAVPLKALSYLETHFVWSRAAKEALCTLKVKFKGGTASEAREGRLASPMCLPL